MLTFGDKEVWPNGPSSVTVNMQEDLTVTITISDELANYYFEKELDGDHIVTDL